MGRQFTQWKPFLWQWAGMPNHKVVIISQWAPAKQCLDWTDSPEQAESGTSLFFCGTDVSSFVMCQGCKNSTLNKSQHKKTCGIHGKNV
jgi:hypothetical protein